MATRLTDVNTQTYVKIAPRSESEEANLLPANAKRRQKMELAVVAYTFPT